MREFNVKRPETPQDWKHFWNDLMQYLRELTTYVNSLEARIKQLEDET